MAGVGDTAENLMLDWITVTGSPTRPAGFFLALFTTNPNFETGASGTEATGGGYARKSMTMTAASGGSTSNTALLEWTVGTDLAAATYTGFGIYSASTSGTFLGGAAFSGNRTVSSTGDKISFAIGAVVLTLD
jgi:hypothetical protein